MKSSAVLLIIFPTIGFSSFFRMDGLFIFFEISLQLNRNYIVDKLERLTFFNALNQIV